MRKKICSLLLAFVMVLMPSFVAFATEGVVETEGYYENVTVATGGHIAIAPTSGNISFCPGGGGGTPPPSCPNGCLGASCSGGTGAIGGIICSWTGNPHCNC
ncbi:MAG: hypothetical protein FWG63_03865 [Defluviitaleaceae bacterium]|nr:hypothetical protein [Defluviitaleaceae bacterium]